jgi:hypothetical protein
VKARRLPPYHRRVSSLHDPRQEHQRSGPALAALHPVVMPDAWCPRRLAEDEPPGQAPDHRRQVGRLLSGMKRLLETSASVRHDDLQGRVEDCVTGRGGITDDDAPWLALLLFT